MNFARLSAAIVATATLGAAPADGLLLHLIAGANGLPPAQLSFERTSLEVSMRGEKVERRTRVDRWNGSIWKIVSVDGRPPTASATREAMKLVAATPVPGYYRVAAYLAAGPVRSLNAAGETVYRLGSLPVGSVSFTGAPSSKFSAELTVDERGPKPIVRRARFYAPAPVRIFMVGRMDRFEAISDYRLSSGGRPELSHQTVDVAGAVLGRAGSQHNDVTYVSGPRPA